MFPLPPVDGHAAFQPETGASYRHVQHGDEWRLELRTPPGSRTVEAIFDRAPRMLAHFGGRNATFSSDSDCWFVQQAICTKNIPGGRITLANRQLIMTQHGERTGREVTDAGWHEVLRDRFGIVLDASVRLEIPVTRSHS